MSDIVKLVRDRLAKAEDPHLLVCSKEMLSMLCDQIEWLRERVAELEADAARNKT